MWKKIPNPNDRLDPGRIVGQMLCKTLGEKESVTGLHWGFVRDKDNRLYINNTEFEAGMDGDCWRAIGDVF